jgi:hypothetical protein
MSILRCCVYTHTRYKALYLLCPAKLYFGNLAFLRCPELKNEIL